MARCSYKWHAITSNATTSNATWFSSRMPKVLPLRYVSCYLDILRLPAVKVKPQYPNMACKTQNGDPHSENTRHVVAHWHKRFEIYRLEAMLFSAMTRAACNLSLCQEEKHCCAMHICSNGCRFVSSKLCQSRCMTTSPLRTWTPDSMYHHSHTSLYTWDSRTSGRVRVTRCMWQRGDRCKGTHTQYMFISRSSICSTSTNVGQRFKLRWT